MVGGQMEAALETVTREVAPDLAQTAGPVRVLDLDQQRRPAVHRAEGGGDRVRRRRPQGDEPDTADLGHRAFLPRPFLTRGGRRRQSAAQSASRA